MEMRNRSTSAYPYDDEEATDEQQPLMKPNEDFPVEPPIKVGDILGVDKEVVKKEVGIHPWVLWNRTTLLRRG